MGVFHKGIISLMRRFKISEDINNRDEIQKNSVFSGWTTKRGEAGVNPT